MHFVPTIIASSFVLIANCTLAGEIREFDPKTVQSLGCDMNRPAERPDRGATSEVRTQPEKDRQKKNL